MILEQGGCRKRRPLFVCCLKYEKTVNTAGRNEILSGLLHTLINKGRKVLYNRDCIYFRFVLFFCKKKYII